MEIDADLSIRPLALEDLDALLALYAHLHEADDALPPREEVLRTWQAIAREDAQIYLGGFVRSELVSACNATIIPNLTRGARPYAVIENVVTHAAHRRKGHGARVMRALLERCWDARCYKVMLMSGVKRADVHGFYEALGFDKASKQAFAITRRW